MSKSELQRVREGLQIFEQYDPDGNAWTNGFADAVHVGLSDGEGPTAEDQEKLKRLGWSQDYPGDNNLAWQHSG